MRIGLVIPTWNGMPVLETVLAAVERQRGADELERVAIDSGSTDDTVSCLRDHGFTVHSIPQPEFNHGTTRDLAISKTDADVVALLTQDAIPADDEWLPRLLEPYDDPRVAAVDCRQVPRPDCNPNKIIPQPRIIRAAPDGYTMVEQLPINLLPGKTVPKLDQQIIGLGIENL